MEANERAVELLEDLVSLTRFMARDSLERTLRTVLREPRHQVAFELSDGNRTQTQVAAAVGLSQPAVSEMWKRWRRLGLLQERGLRITHIVSLLDLGWDIALPQESQGGRSGRTQRIETLEKEDKT